MQFYTVIWRDRSDDYMFTEVELSHNPSDLSPIAWVQLAALVEYSDYEEEQLSDILDDLAENGYDLLDVVKGKLESVL